MDILLLIIQIISVTGLFLLITVPELLTRSGRAQLKKKTVGPTYWGVYPGCQTEEAESLRTIEVKTKKSKELVVAGSKMYAQGRGVKAE
jgi:hypothetical protein